MKIEAAHILKYCIETYGTKVATAPGEVNIFALEGGSVDLTPNNDAPDLWNDASVIISHDTQGAPYFAHIGEATCEPGVSATRSKRSLKLGGVARIAIGFHENKWKRGFHKGILNHPALVQCAPITVHRDKNGDGKRTGDPITTDVTGLNWHGTRPGLKPTIVGEWSYACNVRQFWADHMNFIRFIDSDPRLKWNPNFEFSATVVDYGRFWKWMQQNG